VSFFETLFHIEKLLSRGYEMKRRIITSTFLLFLLLISSAYAEYPTSTPESMGPLNFNLSDGIKDAFDSITGLTSSTETSGGVESMASGSSTSSGAAVVIWTGGGDNELASNPENWSGGLVPQNGDRVAYDGTSGKNSSWDLFVTLFSLQVNSGYTGFVTIANTILTTGNFVLWTGAVDNDASNPGNWADNVLPQNGENILFDGSSSANCTWNINITPKLLVLSTGYGGTVTLNAALSMTGSLTVSGGVLALTNKALSVDGYLLINPEGTIDGGSSTITLTGNWSNNSGNFNPGTSTVVFAGAGQKIFGSTTFYNLEKIAACPGDTLYFAKWSQQTILGRVTLKGTEGCLLALRSTEDGQPWYIDPQGTRNILYASIKDMNNINFVDIIAVHSDDAGGNSQSVKFGGSQCVCRDEKLLLAQIICRDGGLL